MYKPIFALDADLPRSIRDRLVETLRRVPGVTQVRVIEGWKKDIDAVQAFVAENVRGGALARLMRAFVLALTDVDSAILALYEVPPVYSSGIRYVDAEADQYGPIEDAIWACCATLVKPGGGNCKCVLAWRLAELRAAGIEPELVIMVRNVKMPDGTIQEQFHCLLKMPTGAVSADHYRGTHYEDVSVLLGMWGGHEARRTWCDTKIGCPDQSYAAVMRGACCSSCEVGGPCAGEHDDRRAA